MAINVTKTFLPPIEEYQKLLNEIWDNGWLTNNGDFVKQFEETVRNRLKVKNFLAVCNGTLALQIAIKALGLKREIITTPFSYVATTSSIIWQNCQPVFVDIDPDTFCIDPRNIESCITERTEAILVTHVFGNPCDIESIENIARTYNLKTIYDGAHAFGVRQGQTSLLDFGDISTLSFHATKVFHTGEGGGIVSKSLDINDVCAYMRNFGHDGKYDYHGLGINGKMSEFHAALGLINLKYFDKIIQSRKKITQLYDLKLPSLSKQVIKNDITYNYSYYPILFSTSNILNKVVNLLELNKIYPRRYFYPCLTNLPYINIETCPIAQDISQRILCLPIYEGLSQSEQLKICEIVDSYV